MIPENRLSSTPVVAELYAPDDREVDSPLLDYELGGVALQDASEGLRVKEWTCYADGVTGNVYLVAPGVFDTLVFTAPGISELSLAFDQNMRPFIAYVQVGQAKFRWYDTVTGQNVITTLDPGDRNPRCCMDDKRPEQTAQGSNDIILAYTRAGSLYYRQQRDRYEVERLLTSDLPGAGRLLRVGMAKNLRLHFVFR